MERLSLRPIQALLAEGQTISDICRRGGFMHERDGELRPDHSWLQRRAGLVAQPCSRTGKRRHARTASYSIFSRLVRALGVEPHELGV